MTDHDPFLGIWQLIPEKSIYEHGDPPIAGNYTIELHGDGYLVTMQWETYYGSWSEMSYTAVPDGQDHPYEDPTIADTISMTRIDEHTLDSDAKKGGHVVSYARRTLSNDLREMTVVQSGSLPGGGTFNNLSIYRRT
ncbi:MAG: hypothetical protein IAF02_09995 [Anaerolineae bacterium]|nr:hypothetical protein [Anaerolineae bacterium]